MNHFTKSILCLVLTLFYCLIVFSPGNSAEIDDAAVFVDAFNAYQQKDYLLVIEKCEQLNQAFPDSPLRDVTLLLIARASLRSGDNQRAAKAAVLFSSEYPDSSLRTTVEDELNVLAGKYQKGEVLAADKTLQSAARKVSADRVAREQAAELKRETERAAKAKAELDRLARIKLEAEQREKERVLAEKLAKASIVAALAFPEAVEPVPAGGTGNLPFTISNTGKNSEEFFLTAVAAKEYGTVLSYAGKPVARDTRLSLSPGETIKGAITFKMRPEMVDGHRSVMMLKAVSAKFGDVSFEKEILIISSAPLIRAVAKLSKPSAFPGEKLRYRVTVLNAGSLSARNLAVRLRLPPQVDFQGAADASFMQEPNGTLVFNVDRVEPGKLAEINLDVKIREDSAVGQELRGHIEVVNAGLHRKDFFTAVASVVQAQ